MGDGRAVGGAGRSSIAGGLQGCRQAPMDNMGGVRGFAPVPPDAGREC